MRSTQLQNYRILGFHSKLQHQIRLFTPTRCRGTETLHPKSIFPSRPYSMREKRRMDSKFVSNDCALTITGCPVHLFSCTCARDMAYQVSSAFPESIFVTRSVYSTLIKSTARGLFVSTVSLIVYAEAARSIWEYCLVAIRSRGIIDVGTRDQRRYPCERNPVQRSCLRREAY